MGLKSSLEIFYWSYRPGFTNNGCFCKIGESDLLPKSLPPRECFSDLHTWPCQEAPPPWCIKKSPRRTFQKDLQPHPPPHPEQVIWTWPSLAHFCWPPPTYKTTWPMTWHAGGFSKIVGREGFRATFQKFPPMVWNFASSKVDFDNMLTRKWQ